MASPTEPLDQGAALPAECIYVYGIVDATPQPSPLGNAGRGAALQIAAVGAVGAVYSWIDPADLQDVQPEISEGSRLARLVRRHDEVVTALALGGAVLPVRLGTLLPDLPSLTKILRDAGAAILAALDRVRGCAQWDLRVVTPADEASPLATVSGSGEAGSGAAYLLGRRDARQRAAHRRSEVHAAVAKLDERLAEFAVERSSPGLDGATTCLARSYLVRQELQDDFVAAARHGVSDLEGLGCEAAVRGPLPAYSFADVRLEAYRHD